MIQFNLLPDVKLEFIKVQRTKRLVITISLVASAVSVVVLLLLLVTVDVFQKKNMSDLTHDIANNEGVLKKTPDLNKILTIQNQLRSLPGMHDQKVVASRLLPFMQQVTPSTATIATMEADFSQNTLAISGQAPSLDVVNTYVDTLKFTTYSTADHSTDGKNAFSNVVLSSFSRSSQNASYAITVSFDPVIFSNTSDVKLTIPPIVTTRSVIGQPTDIFKSSH
jgi:hypothetical protein